MTFSTSEEFAFLGMFICFFVCPSVSLPVFTMTPKEDLSGISYVGGARPKERMFELGKDLDQILTTKEK